MQTVSEAWKTNQNALVRSRGFVNVTLGDNQAIPHEKIKEVIHSRSYDPMGFELPTNNISIDIFNFDGTYTQLYEDYAGERIKVTVEYGYYLDGTTETIPGGVFWTTDVSFADNILTIVADCSLSLADAELEIQYQPDETTRVIWEGLQSDVTVSETTEFASNTKFAAMVATIEQKANITINTNSEFDNMTVPPISVYGKQIELFQMMVNAALQKCVIGRDDQVYIDNPAQTTAVGVITLNNCMDIPTYSLSKKIRQIEVNAFSLDSMEAKTYDTTTTSGFKAIYVDTSQEVFKSVSIKNGYSCQQVSKSKGQYNITTQQKNAHIILYTFVVGNQNTSKNVYEQSETGDICDVTNTLMAPISTEKIAKYFANRKLYDFELRGDPARDVGDYVMVSLTDDEDETTYRKALILSSELRFDGSFKENLTVRIIETEFEQGE